MKTVEKYIFRNYSENFPALFENEKQRLQAYIGNEFQIEHIGSTAVPGLGGKGVIDIMVSISKDRWVEVLEEFQTLGYEYKKKDDERESQKLFLMANLPDSELGTRIYHIHLTFPGSNEFKNSIGFRDYLRNNLEALKKYEQIKKKASDEAQKHVTKDDMRDVYGKMKEDFIKNALENCC